jgi:glutaredoxin
VNKEKKIIFGTIVVCLALAGLFVYSIIKQSPSVVQTKNIIFFYGRECPHCKEAEKFIQDNKIDQKIEFDSVEVWHNEDNAKLMLGKTKECGLDESKVGVPLVYSQGKCYLGTPDIEAFFRQKTGL